MPKTKGAHVVNAVKILRRNRERATKLLPERLHRYLELRILPSSWYPMEDQLGLLHAIAALMPAAPDPWLTMGRGTALMDLAGVYRNHLRKGDPERTLTFMGALWRSTNDSGDLTTEVERPGVVMVRLHAYNLHSAERCRMVDGYLLEVVEQAGGRDVQVKHLRCTAAKKPDCVWRVEWRA